MRFAIDVMLISDLTIFSFLVYDDTRSDSLRLEMPA